MRRVFLLLVAGLALAAVLSACGDDDEPAATSSDPAATSGTPAGTTEGPGNTTGTAITGSGPLDGQRFTAGRIEGRKLVDGTELALTFDGGRLNAKAGCNTIAGSYVFESDRLQQLDAVQTMMGCPEPGVDKQELWFAEFLKRGAEAKLEDGTLNLRRGDVSIAFEPDDGPGGPPPIEGTRWVLVSLAEAKAGPDGTVSSLPAGVDPPTLEIKGGKAAIFAGCNRGGGPAEYRADGFIVFGQLGLTRKACRGAAGDLEAQVLAVLDGKVAAGYEGDQLSLTKGGNRLLFHAA